jgi:hypothetical protein
VNDGAVVVAPGAQASFELTQQGVYTVGVRAVDNAGNVSAVATRVVRIDTNAPAVSGLAVTPNVLTTPNHKMVDISVSYLASDNSGAAVCTLGVTSNEPVNGTGDGDSAPDWEVVSANLVRLRAERASTGSGRVYTVAVTCADAAGHTTTRTADVNVPRGKK